MSIIANPQVRMTFESEQGGARVQLGTIYMEIYREECLNGVLNFLSLARSCQEGDDLTFVKDTKPHKEGEDVLSYVGTSNRFIPGEVFICGMDAPSVFNDSKLPCPNPRGRHRYGSVGLVRSGVDGTIHSSFYISLSRDILVNSLFDGIHPVIGQVIRGFPVLDQINKLDPTRTIILTVESDQHTEPVENDEISGSET